MPAGKEAHQAATTPEHLVEMAGGAFDQLDADRNRSIAFGFIATLAVANLTSVSLRVAKRTGTSTLAGLEGSALAAARRRAHETSRSRISVDEAFGGFVWRMFEEALAAAEAAERGDERSKEVASRLFEGIDRYIERYAVASIDDLDRAGILQAARISDPDLGSRQRGARRKGDRSKGADMSVRPRRPNPVTLTFPFFLAANGWWIHGWMGGLVAAGGYLALLLLINSVALRWSLPDNLDRFVRRFQTIKWTLFLAFLIGTSLAGISFGRVD